MLTSKRCKLGVVPDAMKQCVLKDCFAGCSPPACGECGELDLAVPIEFGILEESLQNVESALMRGEDLVSSGEGDACVVSGWRVG